MTDSQILDMNNKLIDLAESFYIYDKVSLEEYNDQVIKLVRFYEARSGGLEIIECGVIKHGS